MEKILVTGAFGQIGSELTPELRKKYGNDNVISTDIRPCSEKNYEILDVTDRDAVEKIIKNQKITIIYHMAGILSAVGEKNPELAYQVNIVGLKNILDMSVKYKIKKLFWPSSIAAFGPSTPKHNTPQSTILEPSTMYGVTKVAGELLCSYYHKKYNLDVRSLRYPGIISYKTFPGGGTTDYAVAIYYEAVKNKNYTFFVNEKTTLPMMYMPDAIKATIDIMDAKSEKITIRTSYNITAFSNSAKEFAEDVKSLVPGFTASYNPDFRQNIADSWPSSIDDSQARKDWGWKPEFDMHKVSIDMLKHLR